MTKKKRVIYLAVLFVASFVIIFLLAFIARGKNEIKNGFNRTFISGTLKIDKQIKLPFVIDRIIGANEKNIYFQGSSPNELIKTNQDLDSLERIKLSLTYDKKVATGFKMFLQGTLLYIAARHVPAIITFDLESKVETRYPLKKFFSKEVNISNDQFLYRILDMKNQEDVFMKIRLASKETKDEDSLKQRDGSGGFAADGVLYYDKSTNLACYTYFYRNGFVCMDTNLNVRLKARTIDTLTKQQLKVVHIGSSYTLGQPPKFINLIGCVAYGKLYLQSKLKADNEYLLDFQENTVIDIYNLLDGQYQGSFYIPKYNGTPLQQFNIIGNDLFALYGKTIIKHVKFLITNK